MSHLQTWELYLIFSFKDIVLFPVHDKTMYAPKNCSNQLYSFHNIKFYGWLFSNLIISKSFLCNSNFIFFITPTSSEEETWHRPDLLQKALSRCAQTPYLSIHVTKCTWTSGGVFFSALRPWFTHDFDMWRHGLVAVLPSFENLHPTLPMSKFAFSKRLSNAIASISMGIYVKGKKSVARKSCCMIILTI